MAGVGSACLAVALLTALYAVGASLYGARAARGGVPPFRLLVRARRGGVLDEHAHVLQGDRALGDPGWLAPALGHAALALRDRGAVPHAPLAARHRALRHRRARLRRGLLPPADGRLGEPVRHARD